jgi:hypothetical protein
MKWIGQGLSSMFGEEANGAATQVDKNQKMIQRQHWEFAGQDVLKASCGLQPAS